jgi:S-DNA-T family DNA segregation ATPase FtsK/SpoIIIE
LNALEPTFDSDDRLVPSRAREIAGITAGVLSLLLGLALLSYDASVSDGAPSQNWGGALGQWAADVLLRAFGVVAWLLPVELGMATYRVFASRPSRLGRATAAAVLSTAFVGAALLELVGAGVRVYGDHLLGGLLGEALGEVMRSLLGTVGAVIVGSAILLVTLTLRSPFTLTDIFAFLTRAVRFVALKAHEGVVAVRSAWSAAKELELADESEEEDEEAAIEAEAAAAADEGGPRIIAGKGIQLGRVPTSSGGLSAPKTSATKTGAAQSKALPKDTRSPEDTVEELVVDGELEVLSDAADLAALEHGDEGASAQEIEGDFSEEKPAKRRAVGAPKIIAPKTDPVPKRKDATPAPKGPFLLPPATLLQKAPAEDLRIDPKVLRENAALLVAKLEAYGVKGRVDEIHPGPVVTMYEFEPESGTKVSKIAGLADDLAMALAAQKVRIVAPIPGKARVGFELPNEKRKTVYLREILEDGRWSDLDGALPMALGQDIAGQPVYTDLATMPHVLVAGATGSGKSVGLNVMLASLLTRKTPEEVRFLMIDPKVVELAVFDGIPHMLLPVVTDAKKASLALRWAVDEMERRYQLFADAGARSVASFNRKVEKVLSGEMPAEKLFPARVGKVRAQGPEGEEVLLNPVDDERPDALDKPPEKLPHIVVVVDEFADLMMVAAKDVESAIARLAQKARAAGIHVILATQRPSVDVITGMIKANFPARIGFKVSQREDSKTILGRQGAEHLLGMGDMLMIPPGSSDLKRVHSAFISEEDVKAICDFLRMQGKPVYDEEILKPRDDEEGAEPGSMPASDDPLYDRAVAIVAQAGYCSISHLQRQLSLGYNKAAKLVERMEKEGVVGPASSKAGGRREVLVQAL